jgi:MFS transporter, DHA1 family, multidrug resistance protein
MMETRRDSWVWLLALFSVASLVEAMFWSQMAAFTPIYLPRLGISDPQDVKAWTGATAAISSFAGLPFLPFWGALADRYARQPVIVRSFVAHLIAGIVTVLAGNIWLFVLGRSVMSLSLGNSGLMMTTLSERAPTKRLGLSLSIMSGASPLGAFLGPLVGGPVVDKWGFQALIAVDVGLMLLTILGMTFGYRDRFKGTDRGSLVSMALGSVGIIGRSARLRVLFPALFLLFAGWMLAFTYVPIAVGVLYHGSEPGTAIGIVLGAGGLTTLVLSPVMGWLGDRVGYWRVLFMGAAMTVVLWPLPRFTNDLFTFTILWAVINGLTSGLFALSFSVLSTSTPSSARGRVMTFSYLPVNLGGAFGPAIGSVIAQVDVFWVFPAGAVLTLLGIGALALAARQKPDTEEPELSPQAA